MALFKKNIYDISINSPLIVVDIGCRWGFADKFVRDMNNILIFGFDPDIDECKRLEDHYKNENIKLVPIGLADKPNKKILYVTKEPACSSIYKPDEKLTNNYPSLNCAREVSQVEIEVTTLDNWAKNTEIKYIDYIKIDTQGAELSILKGAEKILPSVRFIEVEVEFNPIYIGQPIFSEVDLFLRKNGFVLWKLSNLAHYSKEGESDNILSNDIINYDHHIQEFQVRGGQIYWADAFYVRKDIVETLYDNESIEQIKRDSEIAHRLGFLDLKSRIDKEYQKKMEI